MAMHLIDSSFTWSASVRINESVLSDFNSLRRD
jgi:hypothetical protein